MFLQLLLLTMLAASSARELGEVWGEASKASGALERITELSTAAGHRPPLTAQAPAQNPRAAKSRSAT